LQQADVHLPVRRCVSWWLDRAGKRAEAAHRARQDRTEGITGPAHCTRIRALLLAVLGRRLRPPSRLLARSRRRRLRFLWRALGRNRDENPPGVLGIHNRPEWRGASSSDVLAHVAHGCLLPASLHQDLVVIDRSGQGFDRPDLVVTDERLHLDRVSRFIGWSAGAPSSVHAGLPVNRPSRAAPRNAPRGVTVRRVASRIVFGDCAVARIQGAPRPKMAWSTLQESSRRGYFINKSDDSDPRWLESAPTGSGRLQTDQGVVLFTRKCFRSKRRSDVTSGSRHELS
jgi:hypothetical protein